MRFMAQSPDNRIFVTDMYNLSDNSRAWSTFLMASIPRPKVFAKVTTYLKEPAQSKQHCLLQRSSRAIDWFYLALTDRLLRYKYIAGEDAPTQNQKRSQHFPTMA